MNAKQRRELPNALQLVQAYHEEIVAKLKNADARRMFRSNVSLLAFGLYSFTNKEFAARVGCDASHMFRLMDGKNDSVLAAASAPLIINIATVLKASVETLFCKDLRAELCRIIDEP